MAILLFVSCSTSIQYISFSTLISKGSPHLIYCVMCTVTTLVSDSLSRRWSYPAGTWQPWWSC